MAIYQTRIVDAELDELLSGLAALSIDGAKGVGKTSTAAQRAASRFNLDDPEIASIIAAEPQRITNSAPPRLIDEWQRMPSSWDQVRRAVDADSTPGQFILTGSVNPANPSTHSGAGRIASIRMRPLALAERWRSPKFQSPTVSLNALLQGTLAQIEGHTTATLTDYTNEIVNGGYPGIQHASGRSQRNALNGYVRRIADRDFPEAGTNIRNPAALLRWMRAYAAATSSTASYESIRDAATSGHGDKPSRSATTPYIDTLERLWILDPVPAWIPTRNQLRKLTQGPKHNLADPALAAALLGVDAEALLEGASASVTFPRDGPLLGALFESLIALNLRVYAQESEATVGHLRTRGGEREVDFIVQRRDQRAIAIEVKLSQTVDTKDVRHLHWLEEQLGDGLIDKVIVTTGTQAYRRQDGVAVVPAALLGP